jgi:hypothetical protein
MRIGVVVVVRAPGKVVHRIAVRGLRVRHLRRTRLLEVLLVNRGNVTERLHRGSIRVVLGTGGQHATLVAGPRDLRPRTSGVVQLRYSGGLRGPLEALVRLVPEPGRPPEARTFRIQV